MVVGRWGTSLSLFLWFCVISLIASKEINSHEKRKLKILINNPARGWSHSQFMGRMADELIAAGHEVHFLYFSTNRKVGNYTGSKLVRKIYRHDPIKDFGDLNDVKDIQTLNGITGLMSIFDTFYPLLLEFCKGVTKNNVLLEQLKTEKYDVGITEYYDHCISGIFHHVGIPVKVMASAVTVYWENLHPFGIPSFSSYDFNFYTQSANIETGELSFVERAQNMYYGFREWYYLRRHLAEMQLVFNKQFGEDFPPLMDVLRNHSLLLANSNEFFSLPRSITPKVVYIGGIVTPTKRNATLSPEIQSIFDNSISGVIYLSFGTFFHSSSIPPTVIDAFLKAFAHLSTYDVVWKLDLPQDSNLTLPANVHLVEWVDQKAILAHPRTRLFITHCGLNSANEAASAGVPVVGMPLLGDQFLNAAILGRKQMGVIFDVSKLTAETEVAARHLTDALQKVLHDRRFAENALLVSRKVRSAPFSPAEKLVRWVEFAAEFPDLNELNPPLVDEMGLLQYYNADVLAVGLLTIGVGLITTLWLLIAILKRLNLTAKSFNWPSNIIGGSKKVD